MSTLVRRSVAQLVPLVVAVSVLAPLSPSAQDVRGTQTDPLARRATDRMRALQQEADALVRQERSLLGALGRLEVERDLKTEQWRQLDRDLSALVRQRDEGARRLKTLEQEARTERPGAEDRLVEAYKLGRGGYLRLLLNVEDLRSFGRTLRMVEALARMDREQIARYGDTLSALRAAQNGLAERAGQMESTEAAARTAKAAADRAVADRARLIDEIDSRRDLNARLLGELQVAQQRLQGFAAAQGPTEPGGGSAGQVSLPIRPFRGDLDWPVPGRLTGAFGPYLDSRVGATSVRSGIEIAVPEGTSVRAVHDGIVSFSGPFSGYSSLIVIDHGDQAYSLYGYLAATVVSAGAHVSRGQPIGQAGAAPAGQPALYFELRIDGKPVDPVQWLKKR